MIRTKRLQMVPVESRHKRAFATGKTQLAELLCVTIPADWPHFPEAFVPTANDDLPVVKTGAWGGYFFIDVELATLVGNGGFHGMPNNDGEAEVGYEIAAQFQNRGYATEALRGLVRFAFTDARVLRIVAHTLAEKNASNAVLARIGMTLAGELSNDEVGKVWRWELSRS